MVLRKKMKKYVSVIKVNMGKGGFPRRFYPVLTNGTLL